MARYQKIEHGGDHLVWDYEAQKMFMLTDPETNTYQWLSKVRSLESWLKFCPYAEDEGQTDKFPGDMSPQGL